MLTVESRLRAEMDVIFNFLGVPRTSFDRSSLDRSSLDNRSSFDHPSSLDHRSSVQPVKCEIPPPKRVEREKEIPRDKNGNLPHLRIETEDNKNRNLPHLRRYHSDRIEAGDGNGEARSKQQQRAADVDDTSPPRPQTLEVTDPRQKLLKSQQLIEKHINKLLKELEENKNDSPSRSHST